MKTLTKEEVDGNNEYIVILCEDNVHMPVTIWGKDGDDAAHYAERNISALTKGNSFPKAVEVWDAWDQEIGEASIVFDIGYHNECSGVNIDV